MSLYTSFAVAGAGPTIGGRIVKALVERGASVVVLARPSSTSISNPLLEGAKIVTADYADVKAVASVLREHKVEVLVSALAYGALPSQSPIADAAKEAGVNLFVPSEFGLPTEGGKGGHLVIKSQFADYLKSLGIPSLRFYTGLFMEFIPQFTGVETGKFLILGKGDAFFLPPPWTTLQGLPLTFSHHSHRPNFMMLHSVSRENAHPLTKLAPYMHPRIFQ
ncbi:hypothetical protein CY34DRAFT_798846 [Suillus luteus UH-Slu-Lm8-n1]|uniref:Unplaced genomic scaffold CY34scaffold_11, whole genome shotgun sequence n=1 Tax=Suillus luteus UH-Slu-Lm8-n1 TaxID=930992 RepID=A0A0D0BDW8_9AGAM|nr:hypothetical protein CY34DRAFT_798846 [Suillus luteus UH-Slu-Lm8-n1]